MKMNLKQAKLVELTMKLELEAREYKKLCNQLEDLKKANINENAQDLVKLKELFQENHNEIVKINRQINKIKIEENQKEIELSKSYNVSELFKRENRSITKDKDLDIVIFKKKENIIFRIIKRIKSMFK